MDVFRKKYGQRFAEGRLEDFVRGRFDIPVEADLLVLRAVEIDSHRVGISGFVEPAERIDQQNGFALPDGVAPDLTVANCHPGDLADPEPPKELLHCLVQNARVLSELPTMIRMLRQKRRDETDRHRNGIQSSRDDQERHAEQLF